MADGKLLTILVPEDEADFSDDRSFDKVNVVALPPSLFQEPIGEGLLRVISDIDSEFFAFCESGEPAADGLLLVAKFAQTRKCDVVRGLALVTNPSGIVGIRGLDLLAAASTQTGALHELPAFLLDLRLENLVIRKALLLDICSTQEAGSQSFSAPDLAARALLAANVLGRMPLVVTREDDRSGDESPWPNRKIEIETLPNAGDGSRRAFLEAAVLFHASPADTPDATAGGAVDWLVRLPQQLSTELSADEKFLVLAAAPDEIYQLHERLAAGPIAVIALRLLRRLILGNSEFEPWLQSALAQIADIDVTELWRASPVDACILCCLKVGRVDLAAKAAQGELDPTIVQLLDPQVLEQALSSLYREHSLLNRDWLSRRLGTWHRQIEIAQTFRERPVSRIALRVREKLHRVHDVKQQLEHELAVAKRQLMRARAPGAAPEDASVSDSASVPNLEEMEANVRQLEQKLSIARKQTFRARRQSGLAGAGPAIDLEQIQADKRQVEQRLAATRKQLLKARKENIKLQRAAAKEKREFQKAVVKARQSNAALRKTAAEIKEELARAKRKSRKAAVRGGPLAPEQVGAPANASNNGGGKRWRERKRERDAKLERWALVKEPREEAPNDAKRKEAEAAEPKATVSALEAKPETPPQDPV